MSDQPKIRALVHPERKQVACVIIQAVYGGDRSVVSLFDDWLTSPAEGMRWMAATREQWVDLARNWNQQ